MNEATISRRHAGVPFSDGMLPLLIGRISASLITLCIGLSAHSPETYANPPSSRATSDCKATTGWFDTTTGQAVDRLKFYDALATKYSVVLLGESHTNVDHHRWQLQTLAVLHGLKERIVIGFEAFPRRLQPVLDNWVAGKLSTEAFLKESEWKRVWATDPSLYMPLFHFARLNNIPMIALNVERKLVSRVAASGWASIPIAERENVSDPATATMAYKRELATVFQAKKTTPTDTAKTLRAPLKSAHPELDEKTLAVVLQNTKFKRFVQAQLTWDRAMAQALANAKKKHPGAMVIGIMGKGHLEHGHGVPHQLKDLGVTETATLIPVSIDSICELVGTSYATVVFSIPDSPEITSKAKRIRLGVLLENWKGATRIIRIAPSSVAQATGLKVGDQVVGAAGISIKSAADLVDVVRRQAPGTWLPLTVRRGKREIKLIAKFPPPAHPG